MVKGLSLCLGFLDNSTKTIVKAMQDHLQQDPCRLEHIGLNDDRQVDESVHLC